MEMITLTINGQTVQAPKNATILEAARSAGIHIPTLCYHSELAPEGACRLCVVEATGARTLVASCVYPVAEGMVVKTRSKTNGRRIAVGQSSQGLPCVPKKR